MLKTFLDKYNGRFPQQEATSFSTYGYDSVIGARRGPEEGRRARPRRSCRRRSPTLDITTPLGTRITFKNPPDGNNLNPSVVVIQINGPRHLRGCLRRHAARRGADQALRRTCRGQRRELRRCRRGRSCRSSDPNGAGKTTLFNLITGVMPRRPRAKSAFERQAHHRLAAAPLGGTWDRADLSEHPPVRSISMRLRTS